MVDGVDWVNFRVADTGTGMSPEQMERILFRPLNRQTAISSAIMVVQDLG
jgi:signal transduction histidine kinase